LEYIRDKYWTLKGPKTIFTITLDPFNPHPYVDLKSLSVIKDELEMLILPFCPIKEVSRRKGEDGYLYIEIEQDTAAAPLFSMNK
jgi:hypothetical protein